MIGIGRNWMCLAAAAAIDAGFVATAFAADAGYTVRPDRSVAFVLQNDHAKNVRLEGDFTDWATRPLEMKRTGSRWGVTTPPLARGPHFYRYVVDGKPLNDPAQPMSGGEGPGAPFSAFGIGNSLDAPGSDTLRVLSLNLHTYQEENPAHKLEQVAFAAVQMSADVLLLQEVGEHTTDTTRPNAGREIQRHLRRFTGCDWHHEWRQAHIGFNVYREGLSILSRAPLEDVAELELSGGGLRRNAIVATTTVRGRKLRVCTAHVTWPPGGSAEVQRLLGFLDKRSPAGNLPTILAGDFNATPNQDQVLAMARAGFIDAAESIHAVANTIGRPPNKRIDYQFIKQPPPPAAGIAKTLAVIPLFAENVEANAYLPAVSDHLGLLGDYRFSPSRKKESLP